MGYGVRNQGSDFSRQLAADSRQLELRGQRSDVGGQMAEDGRQTTDEIFLCAVSYEL